MPKYRITWKDDIVCWMDITADSPEEALEKLRTGDTTQAEEESRDMEPGYNMRNIKVQEY